MRTLSLLLLSAPALACGVPLPDMAVTEVLGWSADGRHFAYAYERNAGHEDNEASGRFVGLVDTRTDTTTSFLLGIEAASEEPDEVAEWRKAKGADAWQAWRSGHPLTKGLGATCGDLRVTAELNDLEGFAGAPENKLDGGALEFPDGEFELRIGLSRGDTTWPQLELGPYNRPFYEPAITVEVAWAPDCRHVAYLLHGYRPSGPSIGIYQPATPILVLPSGPAIHIMAHRSAEATVEPIFDALSGAGFAPHVGPNALKSREDTVIYTRATAAHAANTLAAAIPGGATVEPLTWPSPADIVVAAGTSALGAR